MALAETYIGAALAAITGALIGIFSWAWQLAQRVSVLEANAATTLASVSRVEAALIRVDTKLDTLITHHMKGLV